MSYSASLSTCERDRDRDFRVTPLLLALAILLACLSLTPGACAAGRPDRILIKLKPGAIAGEVDNFHSRSRTRLLRHFRQMEDLQVIELPPGCSAADAIASYQQSGLVEFAEPDFLITSASAPNDPHALDGSSWYFQNTGQGGGLVGADIHAIEAWNTLRSASNVIVALIDTGLRIDHEDIAPNLWTNPGEIPGNGIDDDGDGILDDVHGINAFANNGDVSDVGGHGTQVAGVAGARGNNGIGVSGVAWQVQLMPCRYVDNAGNGSLSDVIQCFDYARSKGAKVINASFVSTNYSASLLTAITSCRTAGIILVAAAGNSSANNDATPYYPASFNLDNIIAVAATTRQDTLADYSNWGATSVDLGVPGNDIVTTSASGGSAYVFDSGTSFSTAMMSGAMALMRARFPSDTPKQLIDRVLAAVDPLPALAGKCVSGGRLNLARALGPSAVADFVSSGSGGTLPLPVQFTDTSFGELVGWSWDFGDGASSTNQNPAHTFTTGGSYAVTLTVTTALGVTSSTNHPVMAVANYEIGSGAFSWVTPAPVTPLALGNDGVSAALTLPFTFKFYGQPHTQIYVGANGLLGFDPAGLGSASNVSLPNAGAPNGFICPFWDDLNAATLGVVGYGVAGTAPQRRFVVSWNGISTTGTRVTTLTFQVVLEEASNRILFQYQDVAPTSKSGSASGKTATVGVEHPSGSVAAQYSYNGSALLTNGQSIVFSPTDFTPPVLTLLSPASAPLLKLQLRGDAGQSYAVEATADFQTWTPVATNVAGADGLLTFVETLDRTRPHRFYRAVLVR